MAKKEVKQTKRRPMKEAPKVCFFCKEKKQPSFLEYDLLSKFTSERGKIQPRSRSGACSKHQRKITNEIKHARHLALLPFVVKVE